MKIIDHKLMARNELIDRLRRTCLLGSAGEEPVLGLDGLEIYKQADIEMSILDPNVLCPTQTYVEIPIVNLIKSIRKQLLQHEIDIFNMDGGVWIRTDEYPDEWIPVVPPIIENSQADNGIDIISDGMHRSYAARMEGMPINVIRVKNLPPNVPYYAYPLPDGWKSVMQVHTKPDEKLTKTFRWPHGKHRWLYRVYNADDVLPGVQKKRGPSRCAWNDNRELPLIPNMSP